LKFIKNIFMICLRGLLNVLAVLLYYAVGFHEQYYHCSNNVHVASLEYIISVVIMCLNLVRNVLKILV